MPNNEENQPVRPFLFTTTAEPKHIQTDGPPVERVPSKGSSHSKALLARHRCCRSPPPGKDRTAKTWDVGPRPNLQ